MANAALSDILASRVVSAVVSEVAAQSGWLLNFFKMQPGAPGFEGVAATLPDEGFSYEGKGAACRPTVHPAMASWDIFNHTRLAGAIRVPGQGPQIVNPQAVGHKDIRMFHLNTGIRLSFEEIFQFRKIGGQTDQIDNEGQAYIQRQKGYLAEQEVNFRMLLLAGMIRGAFYNAVQGQNVYIALDSAPSGAYTDVDLGHPAGNRTTLNMNGDGAIITTVWAGNRSTATPISNCLVINARLLKMCGQRLAHVLINSANVMDVLANTAEVTAVAGTANTPFVTWEREPGRGPDGVDYNGSIFRLTGLPFVTWHVVDDIVQAPGPDGTVTTYNIVPSGRAVFLPEPNDNLFTCWEGRSAVVENYGAPVKEVRGMHAWGMTVPDTASIDLRVVDRAIIAPNIPTCWAYGTIA